MLQSSNSCIEEHKSATRVASNFFLNPPPFQVDYSHECSTREKGGNSLLLREKVTGKLLDLINRLFLSKCSTPSPLPIIKFPPYICEVTKAENLKTGRGRQIDTH